MVGGGDVVVQGLDGPWTFNKQFYCSLNSGRLG